MAVTFLACFQATFHCFSLLLTLQFSCQNFATSKMSEERLITSCSHSTAEVSMGSAGLGSCGGEYSSLIPFYRGFGEKSC